MKALKEKRISLRSLWRRGLVILSLFALVFASCGESSGVDESGGVPIARIVVRDPPANDQYFGMPVDLTGTTLEVWYTNGKKEIVSDTSKFLAYPRIVTGYYTDDGFVGMGGCYITYKDFFNFRGLPRNEDDGSYAAFDGKVWGIWTTNTTEPGYGPINMENVKEGLYAMGLHLTGAPKMKKDAYVDDEEFDLSALVLEADYFWHNEETNTYERDRKVLNVADTTWRILPSYEKNADGTSKGYIYVTVGYDFYDWMRADFGSGEWARGVTTSLKLETVYTVDKIDLKSPPNFDDYFYWQKNTPAAWADRLGDDAKLVVSYTGGKPDREFFIRDLQNDWNKANIWYNASPGKGGAGYDYAQGPGADAAAVPGEEKIIYRDFYIVPIKYPLTTKGNKDPCITLYYRGVTKDIPIDVFTTLVSVSAVSKNGGDILFRPGAIRDNDKDDGMPGSGGLAALLNVTAIYQAYNNPSVQSKPLSLIYKGELGQKLRRSKDYSWEEDAEGNHVDDTSFGGEYIPYYTFAKDGTDSAYDKAYAKWLKQAQNWDVKDKGKENIIQSVTVGHVADKADSDDTTFEFKTLDYLYWDSVAGDYAAATHVFDPISGVGGEENFRWNLKKTLDANNLIYYHWVDRSENPSTGDPQDYTSGVKSKAKTDKPSITWIVKE